MFDPMMQRVQIAWWVGGFDANVDGRIETSIAIQFDLHKFVSDGGRSQDCALPGMSLARCPARS